MTSNMDREMILADFQVKYWARLSSHLQPRGFPVPKGWPLHSVCLSTAVLCGLGFFLYSTWLGMCVCCELWGIMVCWGVCRMCYVRFECGL